MTQETNHRDIKQTYFMRARLDVWGQRLRTATYNRTPAGWAALFIDLWYSPTLDSLEYLIAYLMDDPNVKPSNNNMSCVSAASFRQRAI